MSEEMSIKDACKAILGDKTAKAIIDDMGLHWAVVAAMAAATMSDNPQAIARLRKGGGDHDSP